MDRGTWVREGGAQSLFSMLPVAVAVAASAFDKARAPAALTWINIFDHVSDEAAVEALHAFIAFESDSKSTVV